MLATRQDLLKRANVDVLLQLAVPTDFEMIFQPEMLRAAINGGVLTGYTADEQSACAAALVVIDQALADADELVRGFGITAATASPLLARMTSTIALYYLYGLHSIPESVEAAYQAALKTLKGFANGDITIGVAPTDAAGTSPDVVLFASPTRRYGGFGGGGACHVRGEDD